MKLPWILSALLAVAAASSCPVGNVYDATAEQCVPCAFGSWADGDMSQCQYPVTCLAGLEPNAHARNASDCLPCVAGWYNAANDVSLCKRMACAPGTASTVVGAEDATASCKACPAMTYSTGADAACVACPPFHYAPAQSSHCDLVQCAPGSRPALNLTSSSDCVPCSSGTYSFGDLDTECHPVQCLGGTEPRANAKNATDCLPCKLGWFSPGGDAMCAPAACPGGTIAKHGATTASEHCVACPPGHVSPGKDAAKCTPCRAGTYAKSETCALAECPPGSYAPDLAKDVAHCLDCAFGTFSNGKTDACHPFTCPGGNEPNAKASYDGDCVGCRLGFFSAPNTSISCEPAECPKSTQASPNATSADDCSPCPALQTSIGGSALCGAPNCTAGSGPTQDGQSCEVCEAGTFSPGHGAPCRKVKCAPGHTPAKGATDMATDCIPCPEGTTNLGGTTTECTPCPQGTYSNATAGTNTCTPTACELGWEAKTGAKHKRDCVICGQGFFSNTQTCQPTHIAKASDLDAILGSPRRDWQLHGLPVGFVAYKIARVLNECAPGYSLPPNATQCQACQPGTFGKGLAMPCVAMTCAPGTASSAFGVFHDLDSCHPCANGTYSTGNDAQCLLIQCAPGTTGNSGAKGLQDCVDCPAGYTSLGNDTSCSACPSGTYATSGAKECLPTTCDIGWEPNAKATSATDCRPCNVGMTSRGGGAHCSPVACPKGAFATESSGDCEPCPLGTYSNGDSICRPTQCPPGHGAVPNATDAVTDCEECPIGTFSIGDDHACTPTSCPVGSESAVTGSELEKGHCKPCAEGFYSAGNGDQCKQAVCPPGMYFPLGAKDSLESCTLCPAGQFSPGAQMPCANTTCAPGSASPMGATDVQAQCAPCPLGTFSTGASDQCHPTDCAQGYEPVSTMASATTCKACTAGYYSHGGDQVCTPMTCAPGSSSAAVHATHTNATCIKCPLGTLALAAPILASRRNVRTEPRQHTSVRAILPRRAEPALRGTASPSNVDHPVDFCVTCAPGTYSPGGTLRCTPTQCAPGYAASAGATDPLANCTICAQGNFTIAQTCTGSVVCPVGFGAPAGASSAQDQCVLCDPGYFSLGQAAPCAAVTCAAGSGAPQGTATCQPCAPGYYSIGGTGADAVCKPMTCASGYGSSATGATDAAATCTLCPAGSFSAGQFHQCVATKCPPGTSSPEGADVPIQQCTLCPSGSFSRGGNASCEVGQCDIGFAMPPGSTRADDCLLCGDGYYSTGRATQCIACKCGADSTCVNGSSACVACPAGYKKQSSNGVCIAASAPTYGAVVTLQVEGYAPSLWSDTLVDALASLVASRLADPSIVAELYARTPTADTTNPVGASIAILRFGVATADGAAALVAFWKDPSRVQALAASASVAGGGLERLRSLSVQAVDGADATPAVAASTDAPAAKYALAIESSSETTSPAVHHRYNLHVGLGVAALSAFIGLVGLRRVHQWNAALNTDASTTSATAMVLSASV
ncbi:hypothetical protein SPRG_22300 [Saprolegnia parasitica CBS 223.65]|uniref:Tyrosine-protein kinase ephrin type A/B receptor-like domain-containing protein n=1 Tax=Saprolegnia parasitica (strain CBS 223.65) TaxID=695850 RepID=A0A067BUR4_SAPPC|nr:hypothetical protein SPRG_22300 [Saprolegnia parasitica CBS 223.65]KDO22229.1 hypothetical protein SPRG_22300 [Saprolegnia parasitica CBS 223.65]|eukprot:XP_012207091.1 hypothetical protein SPRG_22300 [Saprolegnia parasitica CBS 223.65]